MKKKYFLAIAIISISLVTLSGCISTDNGNGQTELELSEFSFATDIQGKGDYESHSSTYSPNEQVYMYIEVDGFELSDDAAEIQEHMTVTGPDGEVVLDEQILDQTISDMQGSNLVWFQNYINPPTDGFSEGEHEVELEISDNIGDKTLTITRTFTVE